MRMLVVSDSHGAVSRLQDILFACSRKGSLDAVVHLGDGARDMDRMAAFIAEAFPRAAVHCVRGNNDFSSMHLPLEVMLSLGDQTLFAAHGHVYGVKRGLQRIDEASAKSGCQVTLFGHTHQPAMHMGCTLLMNPGSVMDGRYLLLSAGKRGQIKPEFCSLRDDLT